MKDKICALIRQTWYETARKNLNTEERLRFYETCFEYEFADTAPSDDLPFAARLLFDMVKADIDADKEKARERAQRSRENGKSGGRPKVTEVNNEDINPEEPSRFFNNPIYKHNTTTSTKTQQEQKNVCDHTKEDEDTHKFFEVCLIFFERGVDDAVAEGSTFWNYYAAMGWKTKGGGDVVDKLALARAWRLNAVSAAAVKRRAPWVDLLREVKPTNTRFIGEFIDMTKDTKEKQITLRMLTKEVCMLFEKDYIAKAQVWFDKWAPGYGLMYRAQQMEL